MRVHVVDWDGTYRIEGNSEVQTNPRNAVSYHELDYEAATRAEPRYAPIDGHWPRRSAMNHWKSTGICYERC
jgi:hypothetical protein